MEVFRKRVAYTHVAVMLIITELGASSATNHAVIWMGEFFFFFFFSIIIVYLPSLGINDLIRVLIPKKKKFPV